jgi:hypothetical protein
VGRSGPEKDYHVECEQMVRPEAVNENPVLVQR